MSVSLTNMFGQYVPLRFEKNGKAILARADHVISGTNDSAISQRMAIKVFSIRVTSAVIAFASQVLFARWLGTFEYGIFVAVWAAIIILATLSSFGMPSAAVRFVSRYRELKKPRHLRGMARGAVSFAACSSFTISTGGALLLFFHPEIMTSYYIMPAFLALACLPMLSVAEVVDGIARPFNWASLSFIPTYIIRPIAIMALLATAIALGYPATAETAMWCAVIATYANGLTQLTAIRRKLKRTVEAIAPIYKMKTWFVVAMPIFMVESFYVLLTSVDVLFVSWLTKPEDTAVYFAATKILALVHFVYFAVRAAASHRYSAYQASGDTEGLSRYVQESITWTFWPSLILGLFMIATGKYFLMLFGAEFVEGASFLYILVFGIVIRSSVGPAESLLVMTGKQNICAVIYSSALFVNVSLNLTLIPAYGLHGAAIATALAMSFESLALYATILRTHNIHAFIIPKRTPKKYLDGVS